MHMSDKSYYGSYRTRTFSQIFPNEATFSEEYTNSKLNINSQKIGEEKVNALYYLLYARFGNSHIASRDENQFKYALFSTIFIYGPTWEKRLETQQKIRQLSDEEIVLGSKAIYNHAFNDGGAPSTATLNEILTINDQNTTHYKKSKIEGYATLLSILETDVTTDFIEKFAKLFLKFVAPDYPLLYETEIDEVN